MNLSPVPIQKFFDNNGAPLVSGLLFTYVAGTSIKIATYTDSTGGTPNTNPIVLNFRGECALWLDPTLSYKLVIAPSTDTDPPGNPIWTANNVRAGVDYSTLTQQFLGQILFPRTSAEISAGITQINYAIPSHDACGYAIVDRYGTNTAPGTTDMTAAFNAAVNVAVNIMGLLAANEIWSVTIKCRPGMDYKISGTVLIPPGCIIDGNGSRFIGVNGSAGSTAYNLAGQIMFDTAYLNGSVVTSNAAAATETTWRVIWAGVQNAFFVNTNIPLRLTNFQEHSFLDGLGFSNCSVAWISKNNFYSTFGKSKPIRIRSTATAAGSPAIYLTGTDTNAIYIRAYIADASVCINVDSTNAINIEIHGSFEETYAIGGIGLLASGAAYCQGWKVHSYVESVFTGITTSGTAAFYACDFSAMFFTSCKYAVLALNSSFRDCVFDANSAGDGGGTTRDLMDFTAPNNDVFVRIPGKSGNSTSGLSGFPTNILPGSGCQAIGSSSWRDTTDATAGTNVLALCDARLGNLSAVGTFPFEGAQIITKSNQPPFVTLTKAVNTLTIDTALTYDDSNILVFNFFGGTDSVSYDLKGFFFGTTVSWVTHSPIGVVATLTNNSGLVRVTFTNLTAAIPIINVSGCIRHA